MGLPDDDVRAFGDALVDGIPKLLENHRVKDAKRQLADEIGLELEYIIAETMAERLEGLVRRMAENTVEAMLKGQDGEIRRYLSLDGYTGRSDGVIYGNRDLHPVIHGTLFETGAIALRKQIAQEHADLIQNERIKDLEDQVASLVKQVNEKAAEVEQLRDRLMS